MKRECITSVFIEFPVRQTIKAFFDSIVQASDSEERVAESSEPHVHKCYEIQPKQADGWTILKNMGYSEEFLNEVEEKLSDGTLRTNLTNAVYHDKGLPSVALEFSTIGTSADPFIKLAMTANRIWNTEARVESVSYDGYYYMAGNNFEAMWQHYDDPTPEQESELKAIARDSVKPDLYNPLSKENRLLQTAAIMNLHRMSEKDKIFYDWLNFKEKDFIEYDDHDKAAAQVVRDMLLEGKSLEYCMDKVMNYSPIAVARQEQCEDYALKIVQKGRQLAEEKSLAKNLCMNVGVQR